MTKQELEKARVPAEVEKLLDAVEPLLATDYQKSAYDFLIEYLEYPDWFQSREGGCLIILSLEVLHSLRDSA